MKFIVWTAMARLAACITAATLLGVHGSPSCREAAATRDHQLLQVLYSREKRWQVGDEIRAGDQVMFVAHTGKLVSVHGTRVIAEWENRGSWEKLLVEKREGDGALMSGDVVHLTCHTWNTIAVRGTEVIAEWKNKHDWESIEVIRRDGPGPILSGDAVYLRAHTGNYFAVNTTEVFARWSHVGLWETFTVEKFPTYAQPPPPQWKITHTGPCDAELGCHRELTVICQSHDGQQVPPNECDASKRPASHEKCITLGTGTCADVARSDCRDVEGCWWNRWRKTCYELAQAGACGEGAPALDGWAAADGDMAREACPKSCGFCPTTDGTEDPSSPPRSCSACEDDQTYVSPYGGHCGSFKGKGCDAFHFSDELKHACPTACGACQKS